MALLQVLYQFHVRFLLSSLASGAVESRGSIKDLLKNPMRITTALLWIIWFSCAFSYYGIVLLTTEILTDSKEGTCDANDKCSFNCADLDKVMTLHERYTKCK